MTNTSIIKCELCGEPSILKHGKYPGYQEPHKFKIFHCPDCNTSFSLPMVETAELYEHIYSNKDQVPGYDRYWEYANTVKNISDPLDYLAETEETYWGIKEALENIVQDKRSIRILEIGSGLGYLTYSLIKKNYNVIGLDISEIAVKKANENFGNYYICANLFDYAKLNKNVFDIVIMTEVIEHVQQPLKFITSIIELLKPEGKAIITTPNKTIFPDNIIWGYELPPIHCWWFSDKSMLYIANRLNLGISFIDFTKFNNKHYGAINLSNMRNVELINSVFDANGKLTNIDIKKTKNRFQLRKLISKIPYSKKLLKLIRKSTNNEIIYCKEMGSIQCIIFHKLDII